MGKGKGLVERKTIRLRKNTPIFEFYGFSFKLLENLLYKINKKMSLKLIMIHDIVEENAF